VPAASNGKPRIGLVGAGGLGNVWAQTIAADAKVEFAAIVDPLIGSGKESPWLADHGSVAKFTTLDAAAEAGLDAVVVSAHSTVHADILRNAIDGGLHALVEKPFTISYKDSEDIVARAASKGVTVMVSQNYRFFPGAIMIRDAVRDGRFGNVVSVVGEFWCDWAGKPYQHAMTHVMGLEMAVHHFDLCRAMFDADAVGGYVREWQPANSQYAGGGAIEALFDMKGKATDFPFTYTGSLVGRAPRTPWGGKWRIELDKETLVVDSIDGRYGVYRAHAEGHEWLASFDGETMGFNRPFEHFIESIGSGTEPWSSGRDNLGTMKMALGAEFFGSR
jgi:predicted dehydrogenase